MKYYDLCVHTDNLEGIVKTAKPLGWDGVGLIIPWKGNKDLESLKNKIKELKGSIDIAVGAEIQAGTPKEMKRIVKGIRRSVEFIAVKGGDLDINRAALSSPEVDILVRPWFNRYDSGLNYVLVRLAKKNNVSVLFDFNEILYSSRKTRVELMSYMGEAAKLIKKYRAPFVISSGAMTPFDLRSPSELISFGRILGFKDPEIKVSLSDKIIIENRKRLGGKWVMPGVEVE